MIRAFITIFLIVFHLVDGTEEIKIPAQFAESWETPCWCPFSKSEKKSKFQLGNVETLEARLLQHIHGQPNAVKTTAESFIRYAAGLQPQGKPIATLLYIGPTGVGKTQLARALTQEILGDPDIKMLRIDLSEYTDRHDSKRLIGAPPGYLGYLEGGHLTNWIKSHPHSVVLLDEIDKTCLEILRVFLHVFDAGRITSGQGEVIDCTNCIFILTSNLCAQSILTLSEAGFSDEFILNAIRPDMIRMITPELYNRLDPVIFKGLSSEAMHGIVVNMLDKVANQIKKQKKMTVLFDPTLLQYLLDKGFDYELGARPLERLINKQVVTALAYGLLNKKFEAGDTLIMSYSFEEELFIIRKQ